MAYTNSPLVSYTKLSPNHSGQRTHSIDRITPHCVVGQASAERIAEIFEPTSRQASCNYGIGYDGRISLIVEEKNRSWCSSNRDNDQRALTIEVASDTTHPYAFRDAAYAALIQLCADICKRNGKKKLLWLGGKGSTAKDKAACEDYSPAADEMILTAHRFYANKSCPGDWMYARLGDLAAKVTAALSGTVSENTPTTSFPSTPFLVDVIIDDLNIRTEGSMSGTVVGQTGKGTFTIVEVKDGWGRLKSGAGWIYLENPAYCTVKGTVDTSSTTQPTIAMDAEKTIWDTLYAAIGNAYGTAGLMGNLYAESALNPQNLQNNGNKTLDMTDAEFTAAFDSGKYGVDAFIHDGYGFGIAQWTFYSRKEALVNYAKAAGKSIGDLDMQLGFLLQEIKGYKAVWNVLTSAKTVREASDSVLTGYERPADQSEKVQEKRAGYGHKYYDKYAATITSPTSQPTIAMNATHAKYINSAGTHYISNSGSDENGSYTGGQAGDQTGKEWCMRSWYNRPWLCVLRHPNQAVALKLATLAIDAALNDHIGYDQSQNRTYLKQLKAVGWEPSKITVDCEADCSAGVCANVTAAGYLLGIDALKNHTGTYTGNMRSALTKAGFTLLTDSKYLTSGDYLLPGDILLNDGHHTATNVTLGKKVKGDWNPGATIQPSTPTTTTYYRVRKADNTASSQIGAFVIFANAKACADLNPGYYVFLDGKVVYPVEEQKADVPFRVKVSIDDLNIRTGPGTNYSKTGKYTGKGVFTIVETATGQGSDSGWGKLKSGAGWCSLDYCQKL